MKEVYRVSNPVDSRIKGLIATEILNNKYWNRRTDRKEMDSKGRLMNVSNGESHFLFHYEITLSYLAP